MKITTPQKIKVGVFVLVGVAILFTGIFIIGQNKNLWNNTFHIYGTFKNVSGLQVGNNVRFVGINIGTVENISIISDSFARVDLRLRATVKPFLKTNALASISSDGLMGDKLINIVAISDTTGNVALIKNGDRINTVDPANFDEAINKIVKVANNAERITNALSDIFTDVSQGKGTIGALFHSDSLAKSLGNTVKTANKTMKSIGESAKGFGDNMDAVKHNFLLRHYFKKKERKARKEQEKANNSNQNQP